MIFSWLDIVLFLGLSQGFFLAIGLNKIDNRNTKANNVLSVAICMAAIMLFGRIVSFRLEAEWVVMVSSFVDVTILLFAPLIYCYIRRLLFQESPIFKLSLWHFIPAFIHLSVTLTTFILPHNIQLDLIQSRAIAYFWFVAELVGLFSFVIYTICADWLLKKHKRLMKDQISYTLVVRKYVR
ncbi:MAG: hypothetical protein MK212_19735, partial [Saprospiraceae bacterium]|nr:hypothetical protein [Saprospiraceae bacterium]